MINKIDFMRKIKKNRILVLIVSAIVICGVYFAVEKAIDAYVFNNNSDIVLGDESLDSGDVADSDKEDGKNWFEKLFGGDDEVSEEIETGNEAADNDGDGGQSSETVQGEISEDEVDLELEGSEGMAEEERDDGGNEDEAASEEVVEEKIYVYITGEVNAPGVVVLNKGSRIVDAINAAGGTTVKANISKVNLVFVLEDGMKVNIPNNNDLKNNPDFEYITMASGDGVTDGGNSGVGSGDNGSGSGANSAGGTGAGTGGFDRGYSVVNINTATQTELESLPGIGPSLALKIINYRKENGKFSSIDEIKNVSGIGESKFEAMKKYIRV